MPITKWWHVLQVSSGELEAVVEALEDAVTVSGGERRERLEAVLKRAHRAQMRETERALWAERVGVDE